MRREEGGRLLAGAGHIVCQVGLNSFGDLSTVRGRSNLLDLLQMRYLKQRHKAKQLKSKVSDTIT